MIKNNINFPQGSSFFGFLQYTNSNILNLPNEIKASQQFCFWKYVYVKNRVKPAKVPYGYSKEKECLVPSLKDKNYWFTFNDFFSLRKLFSKDFQLGLVMINGPFTVVDIDNYQEYTPLDILLVNMLKKGAYVEVSPSGKGLHIFYKGIWDHERNKNTNFIHSNEVCTTCEVYSGKDVRFVTLTGQRLLNISHNYEMPLVSASGIFKELRSLQEIFFDPLEKKQSCEIFDVNTSVNLCSNIRKSYVSKQLGENINNLDFQELNRIHDSIKNMILDSGTGLKYSDLCHDINSCYSSISEADWTFCLIVAAFINNDLNYNHKYQILEYFFHKDRPDRVKKARRDYVDRTIQKALYVSTEHKLFANKSFASGNDIDIKTFLISNKNVSQPEQSLLNFNPEIKNKNLDSKNVIQKSNSIDKNSVLKICNTLKIFHLGRSVKNFEYIQKQKDNYLKAMIPISLNQNDLVYYIEILQQYASAIIHKENMRDVYIQINMNTVLSNLNKSLSGQTRQVLKGTIHKLSAVHLEYNKKISKDGFWCKEVANLLSYKLIYKKEGSRKNLHKKLWIKMHPAIFDIIKSSSYNYAVFNKESYELLNCNKTRLLYYYFSISTLPGLFSCKFSMDDLIELWPTTSNRQTVWARKVEMLNILRQFEEKAKKMIDLDVHLCIRGIDTVNVQVRKRKLLLM